MEEESEFIRQKKIDIIEELFAEPKKKNKNRYKEEDAIEITLVKKVVKRFVETPAVIARKAEIEAIKNVICQLLTNQESVFVQSDEYSVEHRREELLYCKKVLAAETAHPFLRY